MTTTIKWTPNLIKIFGAVGGLASINRFSMVRLSRPESVLEHTGMVVLLCYLLHNAARAAGLRVGEIGPLLAQAAVHDMDELVTGDIARPTKYASKKLRAALATLEKHGVTKIGEALDDTYLANDHEHAKEGVPGMILRVADMAAVVYKIWDEVLMQGNMYMVRQAIHVQHHLVKLHNELRNELPIDEGEQVIGEWLATIVNELINIAALAAKCDNALHGTIKEEIFTNEN